MIKKKKGEERNVQKPRAHILITLPDIAIGTEKKLYGAKVTSVVCVAI